MVTAEKNIARQRTAPTLYKIAGDSARGGLGEGVAMFIAAIRDDPGSAISLARHGIHVRLRSKGWR